MKFQRIGGLSSVNQKAGYKASKKGSWSHYPPCRRGIYAFPSNVNFSYFMIGGDMSDASKPGGKHFYVRDKDGNRITYTNILAQREAHFKQMSEYLKLEGLRKTLFEDKAFGKISYSKGGWATKPHKIREFEYNGEIWHHLREHVKPKDIIFTKGSWIKTSMLVYKEALRKELHSIKKMLNEHFPIRELKHFANSRTADDHLEVFIEHI